MLFELTDSSKIACFTQICSNLRRIGEDLIIDAQSGFITLRALNDTHSALPVVQINPVFFQRYTYSSHELQIARKVSCRPVLMALNSGGFGVTKFESLVIEVQPEKASLTMICRITAGGSHIQRTWEIPSERTTVLNAVFDHASVAVTVQCRSDVMNGFKNIFRGTKNVMLTCAKAKIKTLAVTTEDDETGVLTSLVVDHNDLCSIKFEEDVDKVSMSFCQTDFAVGISLSSILSQRMELHVIGPGYPILMRASLANMVLLQMAFATTDNDNNIDTSDCIYQQEGPTATEPASFDRFTSRRTPVPQSVWPFQYDL